MFEEGLVEEDRCTFGRKPNYVLMGPAEMLPSVEPGKLKPDRT